ncbi:MAG: hypothetical protein ABEI57_04345 [Halapricum sp.]
MEVATIITVATVLILLALIGIARWLIPKALSLEDDGDDQHPPSA